MLGGALLAGGPDHQHEICRRVYLGLPAYVAGVSSGWGEMMVLLFCPDLEVTLLNQGEVYRK